MFALMPALRAFFQCLVITFLVLLDEAIEADVSPDFEAQVITLQKEQKT